MDLVTTTPFGQRPISAVLMKHMQMGSVDRDLPEVNKWSVFRDLCTARKAYGVTDRDLTVLNALLSFYPKNDLDPQNELIVFPSNASLSERAHGMAESTLRRHLASLVQAGIIARHDSPNGKRYATKGRGGQILRAYGFNLSPLLAQAQDISQAAETAREEARTLRHLRGEITVMKRDAIKLLEYGLTHQPRPAWAAIQERLMVLHKHMRRVIGLEILEELRTSLDELLVDIRAELTVKTEEMSGTDIQNERHCQNSNTEEFGKEERVEKKSQADDIALPLSIVARACPDIEPYASGPLLSWHDLLRTSDRLYTMMGITAHAWENAKTVMGQQNAAVTIACILQRIEQIKSPGGYIRSLTRKAEYGAFSPIPMVMALLNAQSEKQAAHAAS